MSLGSGLRPWAPRFQIEHHPAETTCPCCQREMQRIGQELTEELDWQPASFTVTEHVRPKYACKHCQEGVLIAELPPRQIEKGRPGPGLLANVLVSKYADHLPLHRQMGDECLDLRATHLFGVTLSVKENETPDPFNIGLFGAIGIVFYPQAFPHLVQQFFPLPRFGDLRRGGKG